MNELEFKAFHEGNRNHTWILINKDRTKLECNVVYFPIRETYKKGLLVEFDSPRVLIQIPIDNGFDFREVPFFYLKP